MQGCLYFFLISFKARELSDTLYLREQYVKYMIFNSLARAVALSEHSTHLWVKCHFVLLASQ